MQNNNLKNVIINNIPSLKNPYIYKESKNRPMDNFYYHHQFMSSFLFPCQGSHLLSSLIRGSATITLRSVDVCLELQKQIPMNRVTYNSSPKPRHFGNKQGAMNDYVPDKLEK